ncbi:sulfotransferase [Phreatobacter sp.]|uniref:sulfotransferase n=1 Tax=Phreatobacter sp. TaxID=1966341 RepID=UPI003424F452
MKPCSRATLTREMIVTGLPRGGTTLVAALIDASENALCLSEPPHHVDLHTRAGSADHFAEQVALDLRDLRVKLSQGGTVIDRRTADGKAVTNYFSGTRDDQNRPASYDLVEWRAPSVDKNTIIASKHNGLYLSALTEFAKTTLKIICVLRDPASAIRSWQSIPDIPVSHGKMPAAEKFWPSIYNRTEITASLLERQVLICESIFARIHNLGNRSITIKYEDIVQSPSSFFRKIGTHPTDANIIHKPKLSEKSQISEDAIRDHIKHIIKKHSLTSIAHYYKAYKY